MEKVMFTAGQRRIYKEGDERVYFDQVPYTPAEVVPLPAYEFHPKYADRNYVMISDVNEYIPGVTAEMIDWWWGNMEKGYHIWAPGEHYGFDWIVPPCEVGYEGSVEASYEFDPVTPLIITRQNMSEYPFTDCFDHCWISTLKLAVGEILLIHMYQDEREGIFWRSIVLMKKDIYDEYGNPFDNIPEFPAHMQYESGRLNAFLPQLFELWKCNPDPWENIHFDLSTKKNEDGTWSHVYPNKAPSLDDIK